VVKAAVALGVGYPVVIDNEFAIWRASTSGLDGDCLCHRRRWPRPPSYDWRGGYASPSGLISRPSRELTARRIAGDIAGYRAEGAQAAATKAICVLPKPYRLPAGENFRFVPAHQAEGCSQLYRAVTELPLKTMEPGGRCGRRMVSSPRSPGARQHNLPFFTRAIFIGWALPRKP